MKKIILAALVATPLCACSSNKSDFEIVSAAVQANAENIMMTDAMGTAYYQVPATKELLKVYSGEKNAMFIQGDAAFQITEGNCVINVVNENDYRLFCGSAEDITPDAMWAVMVSQPVEAVAEEPAPVVEEAATEEVATEEAVAVEEAPVAEEVTEEVEAPVAE